MKLEDCKVLITGGTSGIGFSAAKLLSEAGARVAICGRDEGRLAAAEKEIDCLAIRADVSDEDDVVRMVGEVIESFGGYNTLVNNAGFATGAPLVAMTPEILDKVYRTNVLGAMLVARESAKHFVEKEYGTIINVSSTASESGFAMGTAYCASKAALNLMSHCWRAELRPKNIRVMLLKPSEVITNFAKVAGIPQEDGESKLHADDIGVAIVNAIAQPDVGFIPEFSVWATNP